MQLGFFNEERRYEKLTQLDDSFEKLNAVIDREIFRPILDETLKKRAKGSWWKTFL